MPPVRIDIAKSPSPQFARAVGELVHGAMASVAKVPSSERSHIITRHGDVERVRHARPLAARSCS